MLAWQSSGPADWVSNDHVTAAIVLIAVAAERYGLVALLAGTEVVIPEAQRRVMDNQGAEDKVSTHQSRNTIILQDTHA